MRISKRDRSHWLLERRDEERATAHGHTPVHDGAHEHDARDHAAEPDAAHVLEHAIYCETKKESEEIEVWGDQKQKPLEGVDKEHLVVVYGRVQPKPKPPPEPKGGVGE